MVETMTSDTITGRAECSTRNFLPEIHVEKVFLVCPILIITELTVKSPYVIWVFCLCPIFDDINILIR